MAPMAYGLWPMAYGLAYGLWSFVPIESIGSIGQEVKPITKFKRPGLIYQSKYHCPVWPM